MKKTVFPTWFGTFAMHGRETEWDSQLRLSITRDNQRFSSLANLPFSGLFVRSIHRPSIVRSLLRPLLVRKLNKLAVRVRGWVLFPLNTTAALAHGHGSSGIKQEKVVSQPDCDIFKRKRAIRIWIPVCHSDACVTGREEEEEVEGEGEEGRGRRQFYAPSTKRHLATIMGKRKVGRMGPPLIVQTEGLHWVSVTSSLWSTCLAHLPKYRQPKQQGNMNRKWSSLNAVFQFADLAYAPSFYLLLAIQMPFVPGKEDGEKGGEGNALQIIAQWQLLSLTRDLWLKICVNPWTVLCSTHLPRPWKRKYSPWIAQT